MISTYENKMLHSDENKSDPMPHPESNGYQVVTDGQLGGCGMGPVGDPNTWLPKLWADLVEKYEIESVLDLGCGFGYSTKWFDDRIEGAVVGVEGSAGIVADSVASGYVYQWDFTKGKYRFPEGIEGFDLCWCSEFLEHVPQEHEINIFAALVKCKYVCVSAALPGFGGHNHVNEQPSAYWIERFKEYGFRFEEDESNRLRVLAHEECPTCYFQGNGLFFVRESIVEVKPVWTDIPGDLTPEQGELLKVSAKGLRALHLGPIARTALCMAQTAKQVTVVNPSLGSLDPRALGDHTYMTLEPIEAPHEAIENRRFHLVTIETEGLDADAVEQATVTSLHAILPGAAIVWNGFDRPEVREGIGRTGIPIHHLKVNRQLGIFGTTKNKVMVVMPHSRHVEIAAAKACIKACKGEVADQAAFLDLACGCLTHNFNTLLCHCLNLRDKGLITHMAMLHSDISADPGWVDVLSEEMCMTRTAAISAVVAIKDPDDDRTSCAIAAKTNGPWPEYRRYIRLRQHGSIPETFTSDDVCQDDEVLLINTGCLLLDLSYSFWDDRGDGQPFTFTIDNRRLVDADGQRYAQFDPEDWRMSREMAKWNIPYAATWKVKNRHIGTKEWHNRGQMLTPAESTIEVEGHCNE